MGRECPECRFIEDEYAKADSDDLTRDGLLLALAANKVAHNKSIDWYQQRFKAIRKWVDTEVRPRSEEVANRYFAIAANGSPAPHERADWSETMHDLTLRAEQAERQRDQLQERLDELKIAVAAEARCTNEQMLELRFDVSNARARQYELQDEVGRLNEYVDELTAERNAAEAKNSKYRECLETIHYSFKMGNVVSGPMLQTWAEFIEKALNEESK